MLKVIAGNVAKHGTLVTVRTTMSGKVTQLVVANRLFRAMKIPAAHVASVEIITSENATSIVKKAAWGVGGAALLGPAGLLAGALGGGNKAIQVCAVTLQGGRGMVLEGNAKEVRQLLQLGNRFGPSTRPAPQQSTAPRTGELIARIERLEAAVRSITDRLDSISR